MTNSDFPRDPAKFKTWADEECRRWPMELTAKAYNAWRALAGDKAYAIGPYADTFADAFAAFRKSQEVA